MAGIKATDLQYVLNTTPMNTYFQAFGLDTTFLDLMGGLQPGPARIQIPLHHAGNTTAGSFARTITEKLGRAPLLIGDAARPLRRIAWCTGGAQGMFEQAITLGVDAYVSGEISEQTVHLARESGVAYIAAGHHATERYGVQALGAHLAQRFGLEHRFIEIDNPV